MITNKISFIEQERLKIVKSREELIQIVSSCNRHLQGYDFTNVDVSNIDFHDFKMEDVVFNVFDVEKKERKEIFNVNFKGCIIKRVSFAQCSFNRCNFDSFTVKKKEHEEKETVKEEHITTLTKCDFFFSELVNCRFKNTKISIVDFRYSSLTDCSMGYSDVTFGDFYMTAFKGTTNFTHARFSFCSITNATFENHCLLMENINQLIQENYDAYSKILIHQEKWYKQNPCADFSTLNKAEEERCELESRIYIAREAEQVYTIMSGIYSGKGFFRDSNKAYAKAKKNEALYYKLLMKKDRQERNVKSWLKNASRWFDPIIAEMFGYGFKVWPVLIISCLLILLFWLFLYTFDNLEPWDKGLAYSICNTMGPYFDHINELYHLIASFESAVGILLVGFLGFVIANKIRNNS